MKTKVLIEIEVDVTPFVCLSCGQLQLMSDMSSQQTPGNCDNSDCQQDHPVKAGPAQKVTIRVTKLGRDAFDLGEFQPKTVTPKKHGRRN